MAEDIARLVVSLEARIQSFEKAMNRANGVANARTRQIEKRFAETNSRVSASVASMGSVLGTLGAYLTVDQVIGYANAWTRLTRSLDASEQTFGINLKSASELNALASEARIDTEAYTKTYIRAAAAIRDYGYDSETAAKVTSTLAKALKLGGAAATEQASTILQFSQALQKGKLDGDEFRTVMENAGVIQELLAKRLKVTKGEIVKLAGEGKLQLLDLVGAMTDGAEEVNRIFNKMPATIDEAATQLSNAITEFIGKMDQAYGISQSLSSVLQFLATNIDTVGKAAVVAGAAMTAAFAPALLYRMSAMAVAAGAVAGPIGLLAAGAAAAATSFALFGDEIETSTDGTTTLADTMRALADEITVATNKFDGLSDAMRQARQEGEAIREAQDSAMKYAMDNYGKATPGTFLGDLSSRVSNRAREYRIGRELAASTTTTRNFDKPKLAPPAVDAEAEKARKNFEKDLLRAETRIDMAKLEADAIGRSAQEVEYMRTKQELLNEARKAGVDLTDADYIRIEALARATAQAVTHADNLGRAYQMVSDESKEMLSGFIKDIKDGTSATEALANALNKVADKLIDMAVNDLVETALGGLTGRGGNAAQGGLASGLASLFGFANGGIASRGRPQPLPRFAGGGVSRSAAIFGEAGPEAAVPLPDGRRIPVDLRAPAIAPPGGSGVTLTVAPVFNVANGTPEGVDKLKGEIVPLIQRVTESTVANLFSRKNRYAGL